MKHLKQISVAKATTKHEDTQNILAQIFSFVLNLVDVKGKRSSR